MKRNTKITIAACLVGLAVGTALDYVMEYEWEDGSWWAETLISSLTTSAIIAGGCGWAKYMEKKDQRKNDNLNALSIGKIALWELVAGIFIIICGMVISAAFEYAVIENMSEKAAEPLIAGAISGGRGLARLMGRACCKGLWTRIENCLDAEKKDMARRDRLRRALEEEDEEKSDEEQQSLIQNNTLNTQF